MKHLNENELVVGAIVGLTMFLWIGWWALLTWVFVAILWALGGAYGHSIRVFGVPLVMCVSVLLTHWGQWWVLGPYPFLAGVLSMGYGIPTPSLDWRGYWVPNTHDTQWMYEDEGSFLGKFWWNKIGLDVVPGATMRRNEDVKDELLYCNILTRGTIYVALFLSACPWFVLYWRS